MNFHPNIVMPRKGKDMTLSQERAIKNDPSSALVLFERLNAQIKEQQETIRELVEALRPFVNKIQADDYATEYDYTRAAELVAQHGDK